MPERIERKLELDTIESSEYIRDYVLPSLHVGTTCGMATAILIGVFAGPTVGLMAGLCQGLNVSISWTLLIKHYKTVKEMRGTAERPGVGALMTPSPWFLAVILYCGFGVFSVLSGLSQTMIQFSPILLAYGLVGCIVVSLMALCRMKRSEMLRAEAPICSSLTSNHEQFVKTNQLLTRCLAEGNLERAERLSQELLELAGAEKIEEVNLESK